MNALLYFLTWVSWGGSWLAIKWQEGSVPAVQSIAYRFALAGILLMLGLLLFRKLQKTRLRDHFFFLLQACCLFSFNFIAFYNATFYISSGLVAVVMSTAIIMNAVLGRFIWQQQPNKNLKWGAPLGMAGLVLLFWQDIAQGLGGTETLLGVGCALLGTLFFSLGNMVSIRQGRVGIDTLTSNAWGMLYGCLMMFLLNVMQGVPLVLDFSPNYIGGLVYLSLVASVLAFPVYLALVGRIGASSAAYVLVATPVLALTLSSLFEGYQWVWTGVVGVIVILLGNALVLAPAEMIAKLWARIVGSSAKKAQAKPL